MKIVGCDFGTMNLYAFIESEGELKESRLRNCYIEIEEDEADVLKLSNMGTIKLNNGKMIIVGDDAMSIAGLLKKELKRPMKQGLMAVDEVNDAIDVITVMVKSLIGKGNGKDDTVVYSIPAKPIDLDRSLTYHKKVIERILNSLGYKAIAKNEAYAISISELQDTMFTEINLSFGSGMTNVCLTYKSMNTLELSVGKGGDWIDHSVHTDIKAPISKIIKIKEKELNLEDATEGNPKNYRIREALEFYYKELITDTLIELSDYIKENSGSVELDEPIPLVVSGGTSLVKGFMKFFKEVYENIKDFPIEISEIRHAKNPLSAVANGLYIIGKNAK